MRNFRVLLFYKYVDVENLEEIFEGHLQWCLSNDIKGRVFFAKEGVNGTVSGTIENIEKYKKHLTEYQMFNDIWFKEDEAEEHVFKKMHVRLKSEIVNSSLENVSLNNSGKRLLPEQLKLLYDNNEDFVIVDARNLYESQIGRFKNAIIPEMKNFREWKQVVEELKKYREKNCCNVLHW
jgi:UPF0176 protein